MSLNQFMREALVRQNTENRLAALEEGGGGAGAITSLDNLAFGFMVPFCGGRTRFLGNTPIGFGLKSITSDASGLSTYKVEVTYQGVTEFGEYTVTEGYENQPKAMSIQAAMDDLVAKPGSMWGNKESLALSNYTHSILRLNNQSLADGTYPVAKLYIDDVDQELKVLFPKKSGEDIYFGMPLELRDSTNSFTYLGGSNNYLPKNFSESMNDYGPMSYLPTEYIDEQGNYVNAIVFTADACTIIDIQPIWDSGDQNYEFNRAEGLDISLMGRVFEVGIDFTYEDITYQGKTCGKLTFPNGHGYPVLSGAMKAAQWRNSNGEYYVESGPQDDKPEAYVLDENNILLWDTSNWFTEGNTDWTKITFTGFYLKNRSGVTNQLGNGYYRLVVQFDPETATIVAW